MPLRHERMPLPDIYLGPVGVPSYLIRRGSKVKHKREALFENIVVAKVLLELVKPVFGPKGSTKIVVVKRGRSKLTFLTSNLRVLFKNVKIAHPAGVVLVGAALSTENNVGDGAVTTMLLATKILEECEKLLKQGAHPNVVIRGLTKSYLLVKEIIEKRIEPIKIPLLNAIDNIIEYSVVRKLPVPNPLHIKKLALDSIQIVGISNLVKFSGKFPDEVIDVKKIEGGSIEDSHVVDGLAIYRELPHHKMPKKVENAKIVVIKKAELRIPNQKITRYLDYEFRWKSNGYLREFEKSKEKYLLGLVENILGTGVNVIVLEKGVDDFLLEYLASRKILVIWRTPYPELERIARAIGATIVSSLDHISPSDLGWAKVVESKKIVEQPWIYIRGCKNPETIDIVLRGASKYVMGDLEHALMRAMRVARTIVKDPRFVYGGGAFEMQISRLLRNYAEKIETKEQFVINAVSNAFESLPRFLAEAAGINPLDALVELRAKHYNGEAAAGVDVLSRKITSKVKVIDSLPVKIHAIKTAFEVALMILRVDKLIKVKEYSEPEKYYKKRLEATSPKRFKEEEKEINP